MLFLSHSSHDKGEALRLQAFLIERGYSARQLFLDSDERSGIGAGEEWKQVLYERLKDCHALIVLCSPNWKASQWCFAEFVYADMNGKEIFPVVIADGDIGAVASEHQAVFFTREGTQAYERLLTGLESKRLGPRDALPWPHPDIRDSQGRPDACPFPGFLSFDERYAAVYFGREPEIQAVLEKLNEMRRKGEPRFLMIVGGSGSGKSSLLKAGVLPRLKHLAFGADWRVLPTLRFGDLARGDDAFFLALAENLVDLHPNRGTDAPDPRRLCQQFADADAGRAAEAFGEAAHELSRACGCKEATVLMPIDQFEELLSPAAGEMSAKFLRFVHAICRRPNRRLSIIGTMRSDYLDVYEQHESALQTPLFHPWRLEPLPRERLADVIAKPAAVVHVEFATDLVERLKLDTPTADAMPLLAFTLEKLYRDCSADRRLLLSEYEAFGGMNGSIRSTVETVIPPNSLTEEVQNAVRLSFVKHLAQVNDKDEFVTRVANWSAIPVAAQPVLNRLVEARLLAKSERGQIEVAHEAIFRCWDQLGAWLRESSDILRWSLGVRRDRANAQRSNQPWRGLSGTQLALARPWLGTRRSLLDDQEARWIEDALWRRRRVWGLGVAFVLAIVALSMVTAATQKKAADANRLALEGLEKQLLLFAEPTRLCGDIVVMLQMSGTDAEWEVRGRNAFSNLMNNSRPFAYTQAISNRLKDLRQVWAHREAGTDSELELQTAILLLCRGYRRAWETQAVTLSFGANRLADRTLVEPSYRRAIAVARKLAVAPPENWIRGEDRNEFERLYWAELVFLETDQVANAMNEFRIALDDRQRDLAKLATELESACSQAMQARRVAKK